MSKAPDSDKSRLKLEHGGLPTGAEERLEELRQNSEHFFTSTLSVPEQALAKAVGLDPISQVMGSCHWHIGWNTTGWVAGELDAVTHSLHEVRERALHRLWLEARALGAHAVVDTKLVSRGWEHGGGLLEFTAVGTAVRLRGAPPSDSPAIALLTADELWKCTLAGWWPIGVALANSVWYDPHCDCTRDGSWISQPLPAHDRACHSVEALVGKRFSDYVHRLGADGVVAVKLHREIHEHHHDGHTTFRLEMLLMGTAVKKWQRPDAAPRKEPLIILDLTRDAARKSPHSGGSSGHSH